MTPHCKRLGVDFLPLIRRQVLRQGSAHVYARSRLRPEMSTLERQELSINGVDLSYVKRGEGDHVILCVPGALGTVTGVGGLPQQIEFFSDKKAGSQFTIVGFDPRGYGESRPPTRDFQISPVHFLKQDALDGHQLMLELGFLQFSVLGWCSGGVSGIFMAALFPQSVRKLVTWGAKAFYQKEDIEALEQIRDVSTWNKKIRDDMVALYGAELQPMWSALIDSTVQVYKNGGDLCKAELRKIRCPTLILHGERDLIVPSFHSTYLLQNITGARLHRYPDGKHGVHYSHAEHFNNFVMQFLLE